jgi:hypothetical protein
VRRALLLLALFAASAAHAAITITSVTPDHGPVTGGTQIVVRGSGFSYECRPDTPCFAPYLDFGGIRVEARIEDSTRIVATTPPHLPGEVPVYYAQATGVAASTARFTFTGEASDAFERVLLPLFIPPVGGVNGALFMTSFDSRNLSEHPIDVFGFVPQCFFECIPQSPELPTTVQPGSQAPLTYYNGNPGRFLYVRRDQLNDLAMNLRAFDQSRSQQNYGTELPVVREDEFTTKPLAFFDIPNNSRFRRMLRVYAAAPLSVTVTYNGRRETLQLQAGGDRFEPAFASLAIPEVQGAIPETPPIEMRVVAEGAVPIWGFVSVTNNETQLITTVTPQPRRKP